MSVIYDAIVLGLGAMGSSTAFHLAKRGCRVLGIEQFTQAHARGSSHGETRLIRKAYFEHPDYVPLLERSYALWQELEVLSGKRLFHQTGLVILGDPQTSTALKGVQASSEKYGIEIEKWSAKVAAKNLPGVYVPENFCGLYEPSGGYLEVEKCVATYCEEAKKLKAQLHFEEKVLKWKESQQGVEVVTDKSTYLAEKLVVTAGPWSKNWLKFLAPFLKVHRVPLFWFDSAGWGETPATPCWAFDLGSGFFYGFPALKGKMKVALHRPLDEVQSPDGVIRQVSQKEYEPVREFVLQHFPCLKLEAVQSALCFYTLSPDENFILDKVPGSRNTYFAAGFSGHGFKFSSLIGEVMADFVTSPKGPSHPIGFLRLRPRVQP